MTKDMRERCARALHEHKRKEFFAPDWEDIAEHFREEDRAMVDAIFAELMEPDEAMMDAADKPEYHQTCDRHFVRLELKREWQAMLRAAQGGGDG